MHTAALQVVLGAKIVSSALLKVGTVVPMPPAISWSSPMAWSARRETIHCRKRVCRSPW